MNRETATAVWYRQMNPSCFTADSDTADAPEGATPVPPVFTRAFEPQAHRDERGLTRLRAIFGRQ